MHIYQQLVCTIRLLSLSEYQLRSGAQHNAPVATDNQAFQRARRFHCPALQGPPIPPSVGNIISLASCRYNKGIDISSAVANANM